MSATNKFTRIGRLFCLLDKNYSSPRLSSLCGSRSYTSQARCNAEKFQYQTAIVREHSPDFDKEVTSPNPLRKINMTKAFEEKKQYDKLLRDVLGLQVIVLPANKSQPHGVFTKDTVVVIGDDILVTRPGNNKRKAEVYEINNALMSIGFTPSVMQQLDPEATMDGSDVIFTGREILVGFSERTNEKGVKVLSDKFSHYPITKINVQNGLHLSNLLSLALPGKLVYNTSTKEGRSVAKQVQMKSKYTYEIMPVEGNIGASNCIYIDAPNTGPTLIHPSKDAFPESADVWDSLRGVQKQPLGMTEIAKVGGNLSCCSILLVV